jgi:hypothetical protein
VSFWLATICVSDVRVRLSTKKMKKTSFFPNFLHSIGGSHWSNCGGHRASVDTRRCRPLVINDYPSPSMRANEPGVPGHPGWLPTQGSHRSGRAPWSASGSSEHGFTTQGNQCGYPVSLRGHGAKVRGPCRVSLQRLHAPASPSLPRVPVVRVSPVRRYYETLRLPTAPDAALRFLRLGW